MTLEEALERIRTLETERIPLDAEVERLRAHNATVIEEKRAIRDRLTALEEAGDAKRVAELEARLAEAEKGGDATAVREQLQAQLAEVQARKDAELEAAARRAADAEARADNLRMGQDLSKALTDARVLPHFVPAVTALIKARGMEVNSQGAEPYTMVEGRKLSDWVSDFAKSKDGKHYVAAGNSGGGGAEPKPGVMPSNKAWADMTLGERTALFRDNPEAARALQNRAV